MAALLRGDSEALDRRMPAHIFGRNSARGRSLGGSRQSSRARRFERLATHGHHPRTGLHVCNQQSFRFSCSARTRTIACRCGHYCSQRYAGSSARTLHCSAEAYRHAGSDQLSSRSNTHEIRSNVLNTARAQSAHELAFNLRGNGVYVQTRRAATFASGGSTITWTGRESSSQLGIAAALVGVESIF